VTTSEQIEDYLGGGCLNGLLLMVGDWVLPIIQPFNNAIRDPGTAASFVTDRLGALWALSTKRVFAKEVGWPTNGDPGATEAAQQTLFRLMESHTGSFAYFEAFDQVWKTSQPWEPYWGLWRSDRTPKLYADSVESNALGPMRSRSSRLANRSNSAYH
jgi:exo-beta-1,3-glucanase (GH17 family)